MASTTVSRYRGESEEYEAEEDDDNEEEEEENEIHGASQSTQIGKANLLKCKKAHLGNESVYHGDVKVRTLLKISIPDKRPVASIGSAPSTTRSSESGKTDVTHPIQFPAPILKSCHHFPAVVPGDRHQNSENDEQEESNCSDDTTTLITQKNNSENIQCKRANVFYLGLAILGVTILVLVLAYEMIIYYNINPADVDNLPMNFTQRLIIRGEWFAMQPSHDIPPFTIQPPPYVIVGHTAGSECHDLQSCRILVRNIQAGQMADQFPDIMYNYLVGGDGYIYEGRGWYEASDGISKMNCSSLFVGFIGNFLLKVPPIKQLNAFRLILEEGVSSKQLEVNYQMFMQKQIATTESPGEALIEILRKWPHWKPFDKKDYLCDNSMIG